MAGRSGRWPGWAGESTARSSNRTCALVDRVPDPDRPRSGMAQGERPGPGVRGAAARGVRRAWRPPRAVAAGRPPRSAVAAARRCRTDPSPDAPRRHRRPRSRGVGADPRRVRGAAAVARVRRRGRGDARCRHPGRAPGGTPRGAGTAARRGRVVGAPGRRGTRGRRRRPAHAARAAARRRQRSPRSSLLSASRPPSSTTTSTAGTSWSARRATASSTGATLSWRTRSGP